MYNTNFQSSEHNQSSNITQVPVFFRIDIWDCSFKYGRLAPGLLHVSYDNTSFSEQTQEIRLERPSPTSFSFLWKKRNLAWKWEPTVRNVFYCDISYYRSIVKPKIYMMKRAACDKYVNQYTSSSIRTRQKKEQEQRRIDQA